MKFSIIIPVYNAEKYIETMISCVLEQSYSDFELFLVNDGSTDGSRRILDKFSKEDSRIQVIHEEENKGPGATRNIGLSLAKGDYVIFLDGDDEIDENLLEILNKEIQIRPWDVLVYGCVEEYKNQEIINYKKTILPQEGEYETLGEIQEEILVLEKRTLFGYPWNKAYKREIIERNRLKFTDVWMIEDFLFNIDFISCANTMKCLEKAPYHYSIRKSTSVTSVYRRDYFQLHEERVRVWLNKYKEWNNLDENKERILAAIYSRYLLSALEQTYGKRSGMNHKHRKIWLKEIMERQEYKELRDAMYSSSWAQNLVMSFIRKKRIGLLLCGGRVLYVIKNRLPGVFNRIKQKR